MKLAFFGYLFVFLMYSNLWAQEKCTPVVKTTKYLTQKGDHVAQILREFGLEPVFKANGSLKKFLEINHLKNQDLVEPNEELVIPFICEEQVTPWVTIDKTDYRLITRQKNIVVTPQSHLENKAPTDLPAVENKMPELEKSAVLTEDKNLEKILKPDGTLDQPKDVDLEGKTPDEISEALRYRMICEGEWTGTQCITRYSTLFATFSGWYNRYDGTDPTAPNGSNNKGVLLSRLNPQAEIGWHNYWFENFKTTLSAGVQNNELLPEAREIPIEQDKKILSSIYGEARYEFGEFGLGIGIKNYDKLYYRFRFSGLSQPCLSNSSSFAGCGVFVHTANIMSYFVNLSWIFYQAGKFTYDAKLTAAYLGEGATGGFQVKNGELFGLDFTVKHDRVQEYLFGTLHYDIATQDTTIERQNSQSLGFVFGYAWKLKDW